MLRSPREGIGHSKVSDEDKSGQGRLESSERDKGRARPSRQEERRDAVMGVPSPNGQTSELFSVQSKSCRPDYNQPERPWAKTETVISSRVWMPG